MHSVSVAGVVLRENGSILSIRRRDSGAWQIPGGVLERDETVEVGVRREVQEETGAIVEPGRLTVPAFAIRVVDAVAGRPEAFVRAHDGVAIVSPEAPG